jgi:uncharacterized membrane protein YtjA (UPF0391 family)
MPEETKARDIQLESRQDIGMNGLDPGWINKVLKTTAVVTLLVSLFIANYYNYIFAVGFIVGSAWNMANIWLIKVLVCHFLTAGTPKPKRKLLLLAGVKFPLLYGVGGLILVYGKLPPASLLAGFTLLFLVISLKAAGLAFLGNLKKAETGAGSVNDSGHINKG